MLLVSLRAQGGDDVGDYGVAFPPGAMPQHIDGREISAWQRDGALSQQAAGSQAVLEALGLFAWDAPVWDVCAGFGGKTLALLERDVPVRLAADRSPARLRLLPGECRRLRLTQPATVIADGVRPPISHWDGHILVDAPCSGLGVLARRPDIRRRPEEALAQHAAVQRALLAACASLLRPGRQLAYVTCTLRPEENEGAVAALLQQQPALRLLRRWQTPHDHPWLEGMYGALLQKAPC
jgi:16S rRNA (cytosine967-C5)-methyltransferase